jgi:hypothetical protein
MRELGSLGETLYLTGLEAQLARLLMEQEDYAEARRVFASDGAGAGDDITYRVDSLGVRARLAAIDGRHREARVWAREAVCLADRTDSPELQGAARFDLGHVLRIVSEVDESNTAFSEAVELFEKKGNVVEAREARTLIRT